MFIKKYISYYSYCCLLVLHILNNFRIQFGDASMDRVEKMLFPQLINKDLNILIWD
ncbi:hypothetical protein SAMN05444001_114117 [Parabacteroides chinchillae]|uniref:Uncharacterized protein n=1 Tax=Parabacteroides chinchillae TaxID=871327 RepID=A0A8G2FBL2_9BACT|nr:hypothetical protein SAMN05444001_114117 [Parabacteroides chinchillae]